MVQELLTREGIALRERVLWRMLYETAARSAEVLALDVGDLDLASRRARGRRQGRAVDLLVWQPATARLLPRRAPVPQAWVIPRESPRAGPGSAGPVRHGSGLGPRPRPVAGPAGH